MGRSKGGTGWGRQERQQLTLSLQLLNVCVGQEKVTVVDQLQDLQHCGEQEVNKEGVVYLPQFTEQSQNRG